MTYEVKVMFGNKNNRERAVPQEQQLQQIQQEQPGVVTPPQPEPISNEEILSKIDGIVKYIQTQQLEISKLVEEINVLKGQERTALDEMSEKEQIATINAHLLKQDDMIGVMANDVNSLAVAYNRLIKEIAVPKKKKKSKKEKKQQFEEEYENELNQEEVGE